MMITIPRPDGGSRHGTSTRACVALALAGLVPAALSAMPPGINDVFSRSVSSVLGGGQVDVEAMAKEQAATSIVDWFKQQAADAAPDAATVPPVVADSGSTTMDADIWAGVAFEIHLLGREDVSETVVDPVSHVFRTGDRIQVHFRPSLPGRITVVNIDPTGAVEQIDDAELPGGGLVSLGPYEFVEQPGLETLRLTLMPCVTPELIAATQALLGATPDASSTASAVTQVMQSCDEVRGILPEELRAQTRAIRKVTVGEASKTGFGLDVVTAPELRSGRLAPRAIDLRLLHQ